MQAKGRMMLKVVGIIMIVGGAFSLLYSMIITASGAAIMNLAVRSNAFSAIQGTDFKNAIGIMGILGLISGAVELTTGIIGCVNAAKVERANVCMVFGFISCAMTVTVIVTELLTGMFSFAGNGVAIISAGFGLMLGLVLPVLFLIGAILNKKSNLQEA